MIKYNFYRIIFGITLGLLSIVLVACGTDGDNQITASDTNYDDDVISDEYETYLYEIINRLTDDTELVFDNLSNLENVNEISSEYLAYISTSKTSPITDADWNVDSHLNDVLTSSKLMMESFLDYSNSENSMDLDSAKRFKDNLLSDIDVLTKVANQYGLE